MFMLNKIEKINKYLSKARSRTLTKMQIAKQTN